MSAITTVREVLTGKPQGVSKAELYKLAGIYQPEEIDKALAQLMQAAQAFEMPRTNPPLFHLSVRGKKAAELGEPVVIRTVRQQPLKIAKAESSVAPTDKADKPRGRLQSDSIVGFIAYHFFKMSKGKMATAKEIIKAVTAGTGKETQCAYVALGYLVTNGYLNATDTRPKAYSWSGNYSHPFPHDEEPIGTKAAQTETRQPKTETPQPKIETPTASVTSPNITAQLEAMEEKAADALLRSVKAMISERSDANFIELVKADARLVAINELQDVFAGSQNEPA